MTAATFALDAPLASCETRVVSLPLEPEIITAHYRITTIEMVLLRVRDQDGGEGLATLWCFGLAQAKVLASTLAYLAPFVHRAGPGEVAAISAELRREINFFGFKGVSVFALSAFDLALHDLVCRRRGASISSVLGRRRAGVRAYWSGLFLNQSLEELVAETERIVERGFRAVKVRTGKADLEEDVARVAAVAAALPAGGTLLIDAVQSWTPDEAIRAAVRLEELGAGWLEDPLVHHDYDGLRRVVEQSPIPIATGENEYLREGFSQVFAAGPRYLLADLERVGGVTEWLAVADEAGRRGVTMTPHVYPQIALQLCACLDQEETWIEYIPWWDHLTAAPLPVVDGEIAVPDVPGLGLELDPERVEAHAAGPWTALPAA